MYRQSNLIKNIHMMNMCIYVNVKCINICKSIPKKKNIILRHTLAGETRGVQKLL